jgi:hypothetical protein
MSRSQRWFRHVLKNRHGRASQFPRYLSFLAALFARATHDIEETAGLTLCRGLDVSVSQSFGGRDADMR